MTLTRRTFGKAALAAPFALTAQAAKPDSNVGGVQIGINVPYSFHGMPGTADDILADMLQLGVSAAELRLQPVEAFLGGPTPFSGRGTLTQEQQAEKARIAEEQRKWRLALPMSKIADFRRKYEDAGVLIQIVKYDGISDFTDDEIDYCFTVAKTLGAHAISCEIPLSKTKRLGSFADKHRMMAGYHGHTDITSPEAFGRPESWETAMSYAKYNGINLDLGHFTAGNSTSPVPFLTKYHDRVTHVHVKDRKLHNGPNVPFGQGDTPIVEVLQLMKKNQWKFQATIEYEYPTPKDSTVMAEIAKCVDYCRKALV